MNSSGSKADDGKRADYNRPLDDWSDPEKRLLRQEEQEEIEDEEAGGPGMGIFQRLDEVLVDFSPSERKVFWLVFVDGMSVAAAAREAGISGNVHTKFKKMLAAAKDVLGDLAVE